MISMKYELFDLRNFNVLEDDQYYYVFRALNRADHEDIYNHLLATNTNPERIRTDRERYEAAHGKAKYTQDAEISLDEMYDHIKMHYIKETNCISLSSNSCVSLDYGGSYYDEYAVIRVPKNDSNANIHHAGQYMLYEVFISIEEALQNENIDPNIRTIIEVIDRCHSNQEIISIISELAKNSNYERNILSRFQSRQYFNDEQQLEYNKLWDEYVKIQGESGVEKELNKELLEGGIYRKYLSNLMVNNTIKLCDKLLEKEDKVVIMCCYDEELYTIKDYYGDSAVIYNGKCSLKQKDNMINEFNTNPNVKVFIGNIIAAGVGISLTISKSLIFNTFSYVSGENKQAEDRIHRLNSTRDVDIYYQIFNNTQYQHMWDIVLKKQLICDTVIKKESEK
jgi:hypothetical protein